MWDGMLYWYEINNLKGGFFIIAAVFADSATSFGQTHSPAKRRCLKAF